MYNNPQPLVSFEKVALQMLQDVQERLVYRTYIYMNTDILNYKPASGDLAYPDKLQMMQVGLSVYLSIDACKGLGMVDGSRPHN